MPNIEQIEKYLEQLAPLNTAEAWDNVGLLVHACDSTDKVLISLDITHDAVAEAARLGCGLIISHHPVIFTPLRTIAKDDVVFELIQNNISAICMHTNLDAANGGVNYILANSLGLTSVSPLPQLGCIGSLMDIISCKELANYCEKQLSAHIKYVDTRQSIFRVALVGGSGGEFIDDAVSAGADCFITGEASYHDAQKAKALGISLIVAGHFATENIVCEALCKKLQKEFTNTQFIVNAVGHDAFEYL